MPIIYLDQKDIPTHYYNIIPKLPRPLDPPLHPATKKPLTPDDLAPIFPKALIAQEMSGEEYIEIPEEVRNAYKLYRPSPLVRAERLEKELGTPAKIYYKYEGVSPVGSHKLNTALAQVYYNKQEGVKRIATETGAGQWGSALSFACNYFGLKCKVYMVRISYEQKPYRKSMMKLFGGEIIASPSRDTKCGREFLVADPNTNGSLGMAISEAVEDAVSREDTKYSLGSVLNHVLLHQTIIGQEAMKQMEIAGDYPDIIIGCHGGGSNFAGISFPFLKDKLEGKKKNLRAIAVEPASCASLTKGKYEYDFGDTVGLTPMTMMYTLGHNFKPSPIHAGGLRYHGAASLVSLLLDEKVIEARAYEQKEVFEAAVLFAKNQGIVPAPESAHAIKAAIDEALKCKESGEAKVILFNLSGHGFFDMSAYDNYLDGKL
ncbi:MAG: TrpB-like pyridoxal phosphate-dependent enzyme [Patescibacteria group bacterium]|nr:TrpB-like pyridoxal phosphate-dependent enzyme [Patescibacteria group bacterium]MDD4611155.1 TrpB-like pyridoxal phosphate-dependent enzyme [Patescibacteria group bacterium]